MSKDGPHICRPCREGVHQECDSPEHKPCSCMICATMRNVITHTEFDLERKIR